MAKSNSDASVSFDASAVLRLVNKLVKNVEDAAGKDKAREYVSLLGQVVMGDVQEHFNNQEGEPGKKWAPWSDRYRRHMVRIGKSGNLILTDTGRLRSGWKSTNYRIDDEGIVWYNPVPYARRHNLGDPKINLPQRRFGWFSDKALADIEEVTAKHILSMS